MPHDPLTYRQNEGASFAGVATVDLVVPDSEYWRLWLWQNTSVGGGGTISMSLVPPAGKTGGIVHVAVNESVAPVIPTVTFPQAQDPSGPAIGIRVSAFSLDVPSGWTIRTIFNDPPGGSEGRVLIAFERITLRRIQLKYGKDAQFDVGTGVVTYPESLANPVSPIQVVNV